MVIGTSQAEQNLNNQIPI